jgi:methyl-accepting chemotaxis protein
MSDLFRHLALRWKLLIAPALIIVATLVAGAVAYQTIVVQRTAMQTLYKVSFAKDRQLADLKGTMIQANGSLYRTMTWQSVGVDAKKLKTSIDGGMVLINSVEPKVQSLQQAFAYEGDEAKLLAEVTQAAKAYTAAARDVLEMIDADPAMAVTMLAEAERRYATVDAAMTRWVELQRTANDATYGEAEQHSADATTLFLLIMAFAYGISILVTLLIGGAVSRAIATVTGVMTRLAAGDKSVEIPDVDRRDELGAMSKAVAVFKANAEELDRVAAERHALTEASQQALRDEMLSLSDHLDREMQMSVSSIVGQTGHLRQLAEAMSKSVTTVDHQSTVAAQCAQDTAATVQSVTRATEGLSQSIGDISHKVADSSRITGGAVDEARRADQMVQSLSETADRIGAVIALITEIAAQTNLLALNATIEAARAGDAGKGFAVVANEVKHLAGQTSRATDEITGQVSAIQTATRQAVQAIQVIGGTIGQINTIASGIAGAIEEQNVATRQIIDSIDRVAAGSGQVTNSIGMVAHETSETGRKAEEVSRTASKVAEEMDELQERLTRILRESRAGNRRRYPRKSGPLQATLACGGRNETCSVTNISRGGCAVDVGLSAPPGSRVQIDVHGPRRLSLRCSVVNTEDHLLRLQFDAPTEDLDRLIEMVG